MESGNISRGSKKLPNDYPLFSQLAHISGFLLISQSFPDTDTYIGSDMISSPEDLVNIFFRAVHIDMTSGKQRSTFWFGTLCQLAIPEEDLFKKR
jgi:hypothetical protein